MAKGKRRKSVRNKKKPEPDNVSEENNEGSSVEVDSQEDPLLVSIHMLYDLTLCLMMMEMLLQ